MLNAHARLPLAVNEPIRDYAPGSPERAELKSALEKVSSEHLEIPVSIGGKELRTGATTEVRMPHRHQHVLATLHEAQTEHVEKAIATAMAAKEDWSRMAFTDRAAIFLRAAELIATRWRAPINAATMLGQSKTAYQAEIDSACESVDFLRFNVQFASELLAIQPESAPGMWNQTDYRPLDGFVLAVAPFNFTAIALNLAAAPALMGNVVLLKPSSTAALSNWYMMKVLEEAGLPPGVVSFLPSPGPPVGDAALASPDLGGIHFTGSTATFQHLWRQIGERIDRYRQYPRIVGETGGKDFIFVHESAGDDLEALAVALVRGAFEYQGQKCSACSRAYVPQSLWKRLKPRVQELISEIQMGDVRDFRNFMGAVIDERSFDRVKPVLDAARADEAVTTVAGGEADRSEGYFIQPTLFEVSDPKHDLMKNELFAPVLALHPYPDGAFEETLKICDETAQYALTGAVFARDRRAVARASELLRHSAGNFYINDKPTGAVVGQQPFGGSRASGTNDKAGSMLNLVRWTSPRTIKETFVAPTRVGYPFMGSE